MPYPVDLSAVRFDTLWQNHVDPGTFNDQIARFVFGSNGAWKAGSGLQSCAVRLSYALFRSGVRFAPFKNCWQYRRAGVKGWLPSLAADFPGLRWMRGGKEVSWGHSILPIAGRQRVRKADVLFRNGIVYFGPGNANASGHITLVRQGIAHFDDVYHDSYWAECSENYFWEIA